MIETAIFTFRGQLPAASFAEFAVHRAARLSLALDLLGLDGQGARMRVAGPPALVDAFEMAMSLGPRDCLVHDVQKCANGAEILFDMARISA